MLTYYSIVVFNVLLGSVCVVVCVVCVCIIQIFFKCLEIKSIGVKK